MPAFYVESGRNLATTQFRLQVGEVYTVYGLAIWRHTLAFLVDPDGDNCPSWCPAPLFRVLDGRLPRLWVATTAPARGDLGVSAIISYPEMAHSEAHFDGLLELVPDDRRLFAKYKALIDAESSNPDEAELGRE